LLKVKDVMITDLITADASMNVKEAVEKMNDFEIGCLLIVENESLVGILTERDILRRVVAENKKPDETLVKKVMSKPLVVVDPETNLKDAVELMFSRKIKKLPVVKDKKLVGLVTLTDIARIQPVMAEIIRELRAKYSLPRRIEKVVHYYIT